MKSLTGSRSRSTPPQHPSCRRVGEVAAGEAALRTDLAREHRLPAQQRALDDAMELAPGVRRHRVALMERLVALQVEHRDLDAVIQRLVESAARDQLQVTRLKRRKLLLKDQIAWLERQIDPDVSA